MSTKITMERVYEDPVSADGFRVLVDRLWPRGVRKEDLQFDLWAKDLSPSTELRKWFHQDISGRWQDFCHLYRKELSDSTSVKSFVEKIKNYKTVTLLYASKDSEHNHVRVLKDFLEGKLKGSG